MKATLYTTEDEKIEVLRGADSLTADDAAEFMDDDLNAVQLDNGDVLYTQVNGEPRGLEFNKGAWELIRTNAKGEAPGKPYGDALLIEGGPQQVVKDNDSRSGFITHQDGSVSVFGEAATPAEDQPIGRIMSSDELDELLKQNAADVDAEANDALDSATHENVEYNDAVADSFDDLDDLADTRSD